MILWILAGMLLLVFPAPVIAGAIAGTALVRSGRSLAEPLARSWP